MICFVCHEGVGQQQQLNIDNVQTRPCWKAVQLDAHTAGLAPTAPALHLHATQIQGTTPARRSFRL